MKKDNKLQINFHNPNSNDEVAKFLTKLVASITVEKYINDISKKNVAWTENDKAPLFSK